MNKKKIIVLFAIILTIVVGVAIGIILTSNKNPASYRLDAKIKMVTQDDDVKEYTVNFTFDGKNGRGTLSYKNQPFYLKDDVLLYKESGRYKKVDAKKNYKDIYKILSQIKLKDKVSEDSGRIKYNPEVPVEIIDSLSKALFLGASTSNSKYAILIKEKDLIKEFNITIDDIEDFKTVTIVISFEEKNHVKLDHVNIYDEITDDVPADTLQIINRK